MQKKILILDDDPMTLLSLESVLTDEGYEVNCILRADMLSSAIETFVPNLIILDIKLEGADGRYICNQLKASLTTQYIPIIMLTALSHKEISEIDCSADAIIGKSFETGNLLRTAADLLAD